MRQRINKIELPSHETAAEEELNQRLEPLKSLKAPSHLRPLLLKRMRQAHRAQATRHRLPLWKRRVSVPLPLAVAIALALIALALSHLPIFDLIRSEDRQPLAHPAAYAPALGVGALTAASDPESPASPGETEQ